jgi:hypothetical protein
LNQISAELTSIATGNVTKRFLNNAEDVKTLAGFVVDLRDALTDYQVCYCYVEYVEPYRLLTLYLPKLSLQLDIYQETSALIVRSIFHPFCALC